MSVTLSNLAGISYRNLSKDESSPLISLRRDGANCSRLYSCDWIDAFAFAGALKGKCSIDYTDVPAGAYSRQTPHFFLWSDSVFPFVCQDITQIKPAGLLKDIAGNGQFDRSELENDANLLVPADKAHFSVEYAAVRYPLGEDDETNEPIASANGGDGPVDIPGQEGDGSGQSLPFNEWDRYCEWTREWGVETLTAPIGSYKYVATGTPINSYIQFQQQVATITCKVYGLPSIPPACDSYAGCVNHREFTIFLDQDTTSFTFPAETLLFQPPAIEFGMNADLTVCYNLIYRFIYRPQGHNFFFYYPAASSGSGSGSGGGLRWSWKRIALDTTNPIADGSAPFKLKNFGYLWSPQTPT